MPRAKLGAVNIFVLFITLAALCLCSQRAGAQADTGRIAGTVTDAEGALIPHVAITVTREGTNTVTKGLTDARGEYVFPALQVGTYSIAAKSAGFVGESKQGYVLNDGGALTVNFVLTVGGDTQQIIVTADSNELVNTQSGTIEHIIDGDTVRDMALNGRNYLDLLGTLPGSVANANWSTTSQPPDAMSTTMNGTIGNVVLNGVRSTANGLYIDGVINKDIGSNGSQFNNIGIDFIEHVSAQTSSFSAQWGSSAGPAINVVTRSGTNQLHGTLLENIRNNIVDANQYFATKTTHLRFNDAGLALGFPIIKDKLFFFGGNEWKFIEMASAPSPQTLPTRANLQGNFINAASTTGSCDIKSVSNVNFTVPSNCNIANQITNFGHGVANLYSAILDQAATITTDSNGRGYDTFSLPDSYRNEEYIARVDWMISPHQNAYARWVTDAFRHYKALGGSALLPTNPVIQHTPANNAVISYTNTISAR
jgi:hypothetical protein